jgi:hypothetical protein
MQNPERVYFSNLAADPEFESLFEYDDLYDFDFDGNSNHFQDNTDFDDSDEFDWDSD